MDTISFDRNGLPSIWNVLLLQQRGTTRFVVPVIGRELIDCYVDIGTGLSHSTEMRVRRLILQGGHAVPFHKNPREDKLILLIRGTFTVLRHIGYDLDQIPLGKSSRNILITKNISHALLATGEGDNEMMIVSAPFVDQVIWEEQAHILARNRHLEGERAAVLEDKINRIS